MQRALSALSREELVGRAGHDWRISEPFLADWIRLNAT